jgi:hypothetical protein
MNNQFRPCRKEKRSAGVPPNTSSPGSERAGMIPTAIAASSSKTAGPNCAQSNLKNPCKNHLNSLKFACARLNSDFQEAGLGLSPKVRPRLISAPLRLCAKDFLPVQDVSNSRHPGPAHVVHECPCQSVKVASPCKPPKKTMQRFYNKLLTDNHQSNQVKVNQTSCIALTNPKKSN